MKDMLMRLVREEDGQGLSEYGLVIALVAAVVIAVITIFGMHFQMHSNIG